jgi:hypothetical protein
LCGLFALSGVVQVVKAWQTNDVTTNQGSSKFAAAVAVALLFAAASAVCFSKLRGSPPGKT